MKERSLIITPHEAKALAAGTLTQIRRPVKPQPPSNTVAICESMSWDEWRVEVSSDIPGLEWELHSRIKCPWQVGDRLWTRETAYIAPPNFADPMSTGLIDNEGRRRVVGYAASMGCESVRCAEEYGVKKTPSVHMPRWASRFTLIVADRRVEQDSDGIWLWVADVEVEK